jgi:hypothetical protein
MNVDDWERKLEAVFLSAFLSLSVVVIIVAASA